MKTQAIKCFILGEDPTIETVLENDLESTGTIVIEILNPSNSVVVDNVAMTQVSPRVFRYIFNTQPTDIAGVYTATVKVNNGVGDDYDRFYFEMKYYNNIYY